MGNLLTGLKRTIGNKITVTVLGVLAGILVLFFFYNYRVEEATKPIKVPYATKQIAETQLITQDMISYVEVNSKLLNTAEIIVNINEVIDHYVNAGTSIPEGGLFYKSQVVTKDEIPNTIFDNIAKDHTIFKLAVNNETTYGNSIIPGNKIDLYIKAKDETGNYVYGNFINSITVLGVRDSSGNNVFSQTGTRGTPAVLLFEVPNDMYNLLMRATFLSDLTIVPVPRNQQYTEQGGKAETREYFVNLINAKSTAIE